MRKIGLNFWVNSDLSQILTAIELGCDYLEICLEFPFFLKKNNVWLLKTAKENGLELAFESPQGAVQMFNPIPQISKVSVKIMKKMLHFSSKFDPLYFNFHQVIDIPTYNILENKIEKRKVEVVKELSKIVDFPLTFENIARKSLSTPEQFSFIKKFDNVFLCLDVGHLPQASHIWKREIELEDWLKSFKNKILTLHLHNVKKYKGMFYDHMTFSSRGLIDLKKVLKKTEGVRFILLETFYLDVEKNPVDKITLSRDLEKIRMFYKEKKSSYL
jgi:sugar phosphate isomerase/epimerase